MSSITIPSHSKNLSQHKLKCACFIKASISAAREGPFRGELLDEMVSFFECNLSSRRSPANAAYSSARSTRSQSPSQLRTTAPIDLDHDSDRET